MIIVNLFVSRRKIDPLTQRKTKELCFLRFQIKLWNFKLTNFTDKSKRSNRSVLALHKRILTPIILMKIKHFLRKRDIVRAQIMDIILKQWMELKFSALTAASINRVETGRSKINFTKKIHLKELTSLWWSLFRLWEMGLTLSYYKKPVQG